VIQRFKGTLILLLLPCIIVYVVLALIPLGFTIYLSITNMWRMGESSIQFVGGLNYIKSFSDPLVQYSFGLTVLYTVAVVATEVIFGLLIGAIMYESIAVRRILTPILVIPLGIPPITIGLIWRLLLHPDFGSLTYWLKSAFGIQVNYAINGTQAILITLVMDIWQWTPLVVFIVLGGMLSIPTEYAESLMVDGAKFFTRLTQYTRLIRSNIIFAIILRFMDSFKVFDQVWMLTQGGPGTATYYISILLYRLGLISWNLAQAASISIVILIMVIIVSNIIIRIMKR